MTPNAISSTRIAGDRNCGNRSNPLAAIAAFRCTLSKQHGIYELYVSGIELWVRVNQGTLVSSNVDIWKQKRKGPTAAEKMAE
eukprot:IDg21153t1